MAMFTPVNPSAHASQAMRNGLAMAEQIGQMGDQQRQAEQQNQLRSYLSQNGEALMQGDQAAMSGLMQAAPVEGFNMLRQLQADGRAEQQHDMTVQQHGMTMERGAVGLEYDRAQLEKFRIQGQREAEKHAVTMSEVEREAEAQKISAALAGAAAAYQQGPEAFNAWTQQNAQTLGDLGPQLTYETFVPIAAMAVGASEGLAKSVDFAGDLLGGGQSDDTAAIQTLRIRAREAGLQQGTPEYQSFMRNNGAADSGSAKEEQIARIASTGIPRDVAIKVVDGVYDVSRDPMTGEAVVIDVSSGQPVFAPQQGQQAAPQPGPLQPQGAAQSGQQSPDLSFGSDVPEGGESAFGVGGMVRRGANVMSDAVGAGEVFPETAEQQRFFRVLEEDLLVSLSQAYGRQPAQALMERIRNLLPQAGTLEGADTARGELAALERRFQRDLQVAEERLGQRLRPADRAEINGQISGLQSTLAGIEEAKQRLGTSGQSGGNTTSSGVQWKVIE